MISYLKLVNFEWQRFIKVYLALFAITFVAQIIGIIVLSRKYVGFMNKQIGENGMTEAAFLADNGKMKLYELLNSPWFLLPIVLCIGGLMFYVFLIWYRDWFGKNTFIYRLLMLPTARLNILLAKATAIMLMVIGLVSFQLILLRFENKIMQWIVPTGFSADFRINDYISNTLYLSIIIPQSFTEFILYYGIGLMFVLVLFTAILLERSFRLKGALLGIGYSVLALAVFLFPMYTFGVAQHQLLYPAEFLLLNIVTGLLVIACSIWFSRFLLKNKITV